MSTIPQSKPQHNLFPDSALLDHALGQMRLRALAAYPDEEVRINCGHSIAMTGGVTLLADGTALVASQTFDQVRYAVNGHCVCNDARFGAPDGRCKHRWGKVLMTRAQAALAQRHTVPFDAAAQPYAFPRYRRFAATYCGPTTDLQGVNGIAVVTTEGRFVFTPDDGQAPCACGYSEVALGPGLADTL